MDQAILVTTLVSSNGGTIVGKTRLQKTVYLLKSSGIDLGFDFDYHHYGPYSEDLSIASNDAVALGLLNVEWRNAYGNDYAVFSVAEQPDKTLIGKGLAALKILSGFDATTLELAATADFLSKNGYPGTAWDETARRKASKITPDRVANSKKLLRELASL